MGIKTDIFTTEIINAFYNRIVENDVYLFGSDYLLSNQSTNSDFTIKDVLEKTIFGRKLNASDISYMIDYNVWEPGKIYNIYDDKAILSTYNYYVVVNPESEDGDYHIFKCIFNNNGAQSQSKPQYHEDILDSGGESNLADGYIWKYMFSVSSIIAKKFKTNTYFPIVKNLLVANAATNGIDTILVENFQTNFGYQKIAGIVATEPEGAANRIYLTLDNGYSFDEVAGTYKNEVLYLTKAENDVIIQSKTFIITDSGKAVVQGENRFFVELADYTGFSIAKNDSFELLPRILIEGDGSGAEGLVVFDDTNSRITSVKMISKGSGYTSATASVIKPLYLSTETGDIEVNLRPIISPFEGHGADPVKELRSNAVCISGLITSFSTNIPNTGTYSKVALVYEPSFVNREANNAPITAPNSFANILILTSSSANIAAPGDIVSQTNGAKGIVYSVNGNNINVINFTGVAFDENLTLGIKAFSINISDVTYPSYLERSGEVLYISDFQPVTRAATKEEVVKILIDF